MSRKDIEGKKYDIAVGVDHATGPFVQIYMHPADDQEGAVVVVDNNGVDIRSYLREEYNGFPARAQAYLVGLQQQYAQYPGRHIGEDHVIELAMLLGGFGDIGRDVYEAFD